MEKLGVWLRQTREAEGYTLEEAEASTRIRKHFLQVLEEGDFAALPGGEVQVRGFLQIYARYLGLSSDEVLARYDAEVHGKTAMPPPDSTLQGQAPSSPPPENSQMPPEARPFYPRDIPVASAPPRWMSLETLMVVGIVLIIFVAVVGLVSYIISQSNGAEVEQIPTATAPTTITIPTSTASPPAITPNTETAVTNVTPTFAPNPEGTVEVTLEAQEHVWVRVTRDQQTVFDRTMDPGQVETWSGQEAIVVETGNGAGLYVTVNGQPLGALGGRGEASRRAWGPTGEISPP